MNPTGSYALSSAVDWLLGVILGPVATAIAVIAVASLGFLALSGRVDVRRGMRVILGCFIIFGAASIASALQSGAAGFGDMTAPSAKSSNIEVRTAEPTHIYDPYAGAAVASEHRRWQ